MVDEALGACRGNRGRLRLEDAPGQPVPLGELHMRSLRAPVRALGRAEQLFFERVRGRNVELLVRRAQ